MTVLINKAIPVTLLNALTGTPTSDVFALPAIAVVLSWQTAFNVAPDAVSISLEVSIDGVNFAVLDTSTAVGGEVRVVSGVVAALFAKVVVATNTGNKQITVTLVAKEDT